jgi:hypothetical protein
MNTPRPLSATFARLRAALALLLPVFSLLAVPQARAALPTDPVTLKLYGKWTAAPTDYFMGYEQGNSALSPKWAVVGAAFSDDRGVANEGAIQVFNAVTGAWVRKILPPVGTGVNAFFGSAVAISGDLVAVSARVAATTRGLVFVYNMATGALVKTLSISGGGPGDYLGFKVAFFGNTVVATAPLVNAGKGRGYIFDVTTGLQVGVLEASDAVAGDNLGYGLAMDGNLVAVGAISDDASRGSVYLFDITNPAAPVQVTKYQPAASVAGDGVGLHLSVFQQKMVIGCANVGKVFYYDLNSNVQAQITLAGTGATFGQPVAIHGPIIAVAERLANVDAGRVHLFNTLDRSFNRTVDLPNGSGFQHHFGSDIALHGNSLLVTAPYDTTQSSYSGAAYLISPITTALPYTRVVSKGDFAPGAVDISYNAIGDVSINAASEVAFASSLSGAGSNGGTDMGAFSDVITIDRQELLFKTRDLYSGTARMGVPSRMAINDVSLAIGFTTLTGVGVNDTNNQLLWYKSNVAQGTLIRTGTAFASGGLAGTVPSSIVEAVSGNISGTKQMAALCNLKVGVGGTTAVNDSALYLRRVDTSEDAVREGADAPAPLAATVDLGQFAPRVSNHYAYTGFSTALTGTGTTTANNAAVFVRSYASANTLVAQKGDTAVDQAGANLTGATYSSFLAEGTNGNFGAMYRATLAGAAPVVTAATNEGLWLRRADGVRRLAFRKGQTLAVAGGAKVAKIVQSWYLGYNAAGSCAVVALVQLSGPGVNAVNDQALVHFQEDFSYRLLMREGDFALGCNGARIGVISRVVCDAWALGLATTVTLTGATPTTDQALYTAALSRGNSTTLSLLRSPMLRLRKGQLFDNQPGRVKSISLNSWNMTPGGVGCTGRGNSIAWTSALGFVVEFENGTRHVVRGSTLD